MATVQRRCDTQPSLLKKYMAEWHIEQWFSEQILFRFSCKIEKFDKNTTRNQVFRINEYVWNARFEVVLEYITWWHTGKGNNVFNRRGRRNLVVTLHKPFTSLVRFAHSTWRPWLCIFTRIYEFFFKKSSMFSTLKDHYENRKCIQFLK